MPIYYSVTTDGITSSNESDSNLVIVRDEKGKRQDAETNCDHQLNNLTTIGDNQKRTNSDAARTMMGLQAQDVNEFEEVDTHKDNPSFHSLQCR